MKLSALELPKSQLIVLVEDYIYHARNKEIFIKKIEGYTYEEIAEEYNLSTQQTKTIVKNCFEKIIKHI